MSQQIAPVLGIESSCDETGIAIYHGHHGLLAEALFSQIALHRPYGGVVPELAARDHSVHMTTLIRQALAQAGLSFRDLGGIAYCAGPGLAGALLVGATLGRTLAWSLSLPSIGIHHLEAHLLSVMLESPRPDFPFLALLVSGGHTLLAHVKAAGNYTILGETLDDAAGEAFDKVAKLLGLGYPGGAALSNLAQQGQKHCFRFPRPLCDQPGLNFSFSGLKTCVHRHWERLHQAPEQKANIACAFEEAVVESLTIKTIRALKETGLHRVVVAGGVSANQRLRVMLTEKANAIGATVYYPRLQFCTDNGAMIAYAGYLRLQSGEKAALPIRIYPRWALEDVSPISLIY